MIFPTVNLVFLILISCVGALPFFNTAFQPTSNGNSVNNFYSPQAAQYSPPGLSLENLSLRQPSLRLADTLRNIRERSSSLTPRSTPLKNAFDSRFSNSFDRRLGTAENVNRFGERVRESVRHYVRNGRVEAAQRANDELLDRKFNLDAARERLAQALRGKKALMQKLHGFGWRGKHVGVPYHTMNDEHAIVRKSGADFGLVSGSDFRVPLLSPAPNIGSIRLEHPAVPEPTTSVDSGEAFEITAAADSFVLPVYLTTDEIPKRTTIGYEPVEIADFIRNDEFTAAQSSANAWDRTDYGGGISKQQSTYTATGNGILEFITDGIPFGGIKEPAKEAGVVFKTENEATTASNIRVETTAIVSTLFSEPSSVVTSETDAGPSMSSTFQTTTEPGDDLSRIRLDRDTNADIMSTETPSTSSFLSTEADFITMDEEFISSTIDTPIIPDILSHFYDDLDTEGASSDEVTSFDPPSSLYTTTFAAEASTATDTVSASPVKYSGYEAVEFISTTPSATQIPQTTSTPDVGSSTMDTTEVFSTDEDPTVSVQTTYLAEGSTTASTPSARSTTNMRTTVDDSSTYFSLEQTERVSTLFDASALTSIPFRSSPIDGETTTTEFDSTYSSTVFDEISTDSKEIYTTSITPYVSSTNDAETTAGIALTGWDFTGSTAAVNLDRMSTTEGTYDSISTDYVDTTSENFSTYPSTPSEERASNFAGIFTRTTATSTGSPVDTETTTGFASTYFPTIPTAADTTLNEIFVTSSTTGTKTTTEVLSTVGEDSTFAAESRNSDERFTTASEPLVISTTGVDTTTEDTSTYFSVAENQMVSDLNEIFRATSTTSTEAVSTYPSTILTEEVTVSSIIPSETTGVLATEEYNEELQDPRDHVTVRSGSGDSAARSVPRKVDYVYEEEPDERTLLNLIPVIISELKRENLTPEEKQTLSQGFGDLWPLMVEESKRESSENMNHELAIFLLEAGEQVSSVDNLKE